MPGSSVAPDSSGWKHYVTAEIRSGIGIIRINGPGKENVLGELLSARTYEAIESIAYTEGLLGLVIMSGKPESFIAGADIQMLENADAAGLSRMSRDGHAKFQELEDFGIPVVVAIMGTCMGAGLELCLACHYRIAVDTENTVFSLPEVRLGLLPGSGGTQRLPRQIALPNALEMLLTGRTVSARRAYEIGLVEQLIEPVLNEDETVNSARSLARLEEAAMLTVFNLSTGMLSVDSWYSLWRGTLNYFYSSSFIWNRFIKPSVIAKLHKNGAGNFPAPFAILNCIETSIFQGLSTGFEMEAKEFGRLGETKEAKALIGLFHGTTKCKKQRFGKASEIRCLAIVGTSEPGMACACNVVNKDFKVKVVETNDYLRDEAQKAVEEHFAKAVAKGKMRQKSADLDRENIDISDSLEELRDADIIFIASPLNASNESYEEDIRKVEEIAVDTVPIVINLFGRSIEDIIAKAKNPSRILGVCYGVPYGLGKYGELIKHENSDDNAVATVASLLVKQKMFVFLTTDGNRLPGYYLARCVLAMLSVVCEEARTGRFKTASDIDKFSKDAGFVGGVAEMCDLIGLDVIAESCHCFGDVSFKNKFDLLQKMLDRKRFGKTCGRGFHLYNNGTKIEKIRDDEFTSILNDAGESTDSQLHRLSTEERAYRLVLNVTDSALNCYQEGIISSPAEGDVGCVFGVGFPPGFGGPFRFADQRLSDIPEENLERHYCKLMKSCALGIADKFY